LKDLWAITTRGRGPPLLMLHGFGWTRESFADLAPALERDHRLILADLPGHGASRAPAQGFEACLAELDSELGRAGLTSVAVLGYSMGARLALGLTVGWARRVSRLILIGGSPGLEDVAERLERKRVDEALAVDIEQQGLERFLERWETIPLLASLRSLPPSRLAALRSTRTQDAAGLAAALRWLGLGAQPSYWEQLGKLSVPTLLVSGGDDAKYTALAGAMAARIAGSRALTVAGCGHAPHLEAPEMLVLPLRTFLATAGVAGA
jgi:2-succinyl-6-hydroxy-2,4-cyclohexadiene-1-carboxylate synthase